MHILLATSAVLSMAAMPAHQQGAVTSVTTTRDVVGTVRFDIRGTNPCPAVHVDFGNGISETYALRGLPDSQTVWYHYTRGGTFNVRIVGTNGCRGEATTRVTIQLPDEPAPTPKPAPPVKASRPENTRFTGMDRNDDGVVTRQEWEGTMRSFRVHDWNGDNILSGDEVRPGATPPPEGGGGFARRAAGLAWTEASFRQLDRNNDGRLVRAEWRHELEDFYRIDDNDDGQLTLAEFLVDEVDDDRGDRFADLDANGNNRLDRAEWHGSAAVFQRLDRNNDGWISEQEVVPAPTGPWPIGRGGARTGPDEVALDVSARTAWTDTGIDVRAGDTLVFRPRGTIEWANDRNATAPPTGAAGPATAGAPVPGAGIGALVGRIGDGRPFLVVTRNNSVRVTESGRLYLGVNDDVLTDNAGAFQVSVVRK
jgi:Ca2+-binding EF-hand superfamily protein